MGNKIFVLKKDEKPDKIDISYFKEVGFIPWIAEDVEEIKEVDFEFDVVFCEFMAQCSNKVVFYEDSITFLEGFNEDMIQKLMFSIFDTNPIKFYDNLMGIFDNSMWVLVEDIGLVSLADFCRVANGTYYYGQVFDITDNILNRVTKTIII